MQLKDIMTKSVLTVTEELIAEDAYQLMIKESIHHLIVVNDTDIVGVLSERDLGGPQGQETSRGKTVGDLAVKDIITAAPTDTIQYAALYLRGYNIGCLPVVDDGYLVGIVTISDILTLVGQGVKLSG